MAIDSIGWEEALARFRPLLRVLASQLLNSRYWKKVDPSDIVQKTMLEAHQKRSDFRGSSENELAAWLKVILGHRVIDEARKLQCQKNDAGLEVGVQHAELMVKTWKSPGSVLVGHEEALRLAEALERLPDDQRRAIELYHLQQKSLAETAELLEKSKGAVASLLHRGQARLRELLKDSR